jgi:small subunit ribosomal protein S6
MPPGATRYPVRLRMTLPAPTYDLVLLLDPQTELPARERIVADARGSIESQGELVRHDEWGERALTYPIDRHASADYHLLQFHAGSPALLEGLDRTLRITDGVLRHRIIKLKPGVADPPSMSASAPPRPAEAAEGVPAAAAPEQPPAAPAASESPAAEPEQAPAPAAASEPPAAEPEQPSEAPAAE